MTERGDLVRRLRAYLDCWDTGPTTCHSHQLIREAADYIASSEEYVRGLELGADMCERMACSEVSVQHDREASILEAAAFAIRALKERSASVLVPREPTEEMIDAAGDAYIPWIEQQRTGKKISIGEQCANVYRAMLAAAPAPVVDEEAVHLARSIIRSLKDAGLMPRKGEIHYAKSVLARAYLRAVGRK